MRILEPSTTTCHSERSEESIPVERFFVVAKSAPPQNDKDSASLKILEPPTTACHSERSEESIPQERFFVVAKNAPPQNDRDSASLRILERPTTACHSERSEESMPTSVPSLFRRVKDSSSSQRALLLGMTKTQLP